MASAGLSSRNLGAIGGALGGGRIKNKRLDGGVFFLGGRRMKRWHGRVCFSREEDEKRQRTSIDGLVSARQGLF